MSNTFLNQIIEDLEDYKECYSNINHIDKPEWAFNFWVLDKLYSEDDQLIEEKIVDYNDKGIDCYVWHEDLKDLYIIQNKFYNEDTKLSSNYIHEFLNRPLSYLEEGTYTRSEELQKIFNRYKDDEDFSVHLYIYVTNNSCKTDSNIKVINDFNAKHDSKYDAHLYSLDDIKELYYNEPITNRKTLTFELESINRGTILSILNDEYNLGQSIDAKYALVSVVQLYKLYRKAVEEKYPIFDANIREYLGSGGNVNKKIIQTLKNPVDRVNFFYYNNGITLIADKISGVETRNGKARITITNPQIVNGCQTVNSINEVLSGLDPNTLEAEFKNSYVMVKMLQIPNDNENLEQLYRDIVTYNNSQNSIKEKTFVANTNEFIRLQTELKRKGLLVCIKQSDKNKFKSENRTVTKLLNLNKDLLDKFGIIKRNKVTDFIIELEKLLQVILAFSTTPQNAVQNKSKLLKPDSDQYNCVIDFIKSPDITTGAIIDLYLLYIRAEEEKKKKNNDGILTPIPFYLIYCFAKYECNNNPLQITEKLKTKDDIDKIILLYKSTLRGYYNAWKKNNPDSGYNNMIKSKIDDDILDDARSMAESMIKSYISTL